ncbi:prepilin peptidase [Thalassococcus sp. BH17M4-6]|uniref:prepilin peptidase n=1 Tax=Thalassococcus sp. BH17M4-6 TaxID=3413148 RepID=UPI003BC3A13F
MAVIAPGAGVWALILLVLLVWASWIDTRRFEIPDLSSALLVVSGLIWLTTRPALGVLPHLVGGLVWPLLFSAVAWGYERTRGKTGLGMGDVKLMAGIGLWCGLVDTILVVLGAALSGLLSLGIHAIVTGGKGIAHSKLAFGPFLCLFAWCVWLTGTP